MPRGNRRERDRSVLGPSATDAERLEVRPYAHKAPRAIASRTVSGAIAG